ncbi:hypothetical protein [Mycobacterium sp. E2989]|uniref:hypothetical protein n=1 Tax=Mycobacterium sp. E2989 TaxID=1834140 RepID=UPI0007FC0725|nr:hypothetical protein [Mycobacterium sp. E2989]OBH86163.1 hypothetical protein A5680_06120 [Mycobacterium sp. E2989]
MTDPKLHHLTDGALKHLALDFGAIAVLPGARPASGWAAWMWWLVNRERERREGNDDVGLPPEIVGLNDLYEAELNVLRGVFHETALLAQWHGEDGFAAWLRKLVRNLDAELQRHERAKQDLQAVLDDYRRRHPHGTPGDTSRHPQWHDITSRGAEPEGNPWA